MSNYSIRSQKTGKDKTIPGLYNSSITRVRPVFQQLLNRDPTGSGWLQNFLSMSRTMYASELSEEPGILVPWVSEQLEYSDRILQQAPYRIEKIQLQRCFEYPLPPPTAFLRWLIKHVDPQLWESKRSKFAKSAETRDKRDRLFGRHGTEEQQKTAREALRLLEQHGNAGSRIKWWAFEGFTEVDCFLETDRLLLLIEGKRTEALSDSTNWYPGRNQLLRNLEVAKELAEQKGKAYGVMLLTEQPMDFPTGQEIEGSFPHLDAGTRTEILDNFLGSYTWEETCHATGIDYNTLPDTSVEVAEKLKDLSKK